MNESLSGNAIRLQPGDLVVNKKSSEVGILLQKHKVLRNMTTSEQTSRWYYAWRVKWNKESSKKDEIKWVDLLESSLEEKKLIRDIKDGNIEHYSTNGISCN